MRSADLKWIEVDVKACNSSVGIWRTDLKSMSLKRIYLRVLDELNGRRLKI